MPDPEIQTVELRACRPEDFEGVLALLRQLWPDKHLEAAALRAVYDRLLASGTQTCLCASARGRVVGFGSLSVKNQLWQAGYSGRVDELVVDREYRNRGIGTRLLDELVAAARAQGCRCVELDSAFHRQAAHRFYERRGFESRAYLFSKKW